MRQTTDTDSERNEGKTKTHIFQLIDGIERGASARRRSHVVVVIVIVVSIARRRRRRLPEQSLEHDDWNACERQFFFSVICEENAK